MISSAWDGAADYGPLVMPVLASVGAAIHVARMSERGQSAGIVLRWFFGVVVGVGGLVVTASHVFFADATATQIGFPAGNPFQFEVAMANFAFAVLGVLCVWRGPRLWEATAIGFAVFYWGAAVGHLIQLFVRHDDAPYNAGPILIADFACPAIILIALVQWHAARSSHRKGAS